MSTFPAVPDGFEVVTERGGLAVVRSSAKERLLALGIMDPATIETLRRSGRPAGSGRGTVVSVPLDADRGERVVIRHCRRGGLLGRVLGDRYLSGTRPLDELAISEAARQAGVPTPQCMAALVWRRGLFYAGDLIIREVPHATPLDQWLRDHGASRALIGPLAEALGRLFAAGVYHPDLHAGNILVEPAPDGPRVQIIDFDRAKLTGRLPATRRDRMLFRFNRALVKRGLAPGPAGLRSRLRLCRALGIAGDRAEMRRFVAACQAHLKRHAWHYR